MEIKATMFGEFSISSDNLTLKESARRSPKMWEMLQYLIVNRDKSISPNVLQEIACKGNRKSTAGALKTMVYRLRNELKALSRDTDIIVNTMNSYAVNPQLNLITDTEQFVELCGRFQSASDLDEKLDLCVQLFVVYKGRFLPSQSSEEWVAELADKYHKMFSGVIYSWASEALQESRYDDVISVCQRALMVADESIDLQISLLEALIKTSDFINAQSRYEHIINQLFSAEGKSYTSEEMSGYHKKLSSIKLYEGTIGNISSVIGNLSEPDLRSGALYCEYDYFKLLYQLEQRYLKRYERKSKFFLFTLADSKDDALNSHMTALGNVIKKGLRQSDVYTKYSPRQYALMLYNIDDKFCNDIIIRIKKNFEAETGLDSKIITSEYMPISAFQ